MKNEMALWCVSNLVFVTKHNDTVLQRKFNGATKTVHILYVYCVAQNMFHELNIYPDSSQFCADSGFFPPVSADSWTDFLWMRQNWPRWGSGVLIVNTIYSCWPKYWHYRLKSGSAEVVFYFNWAESGLCSWIDYIAVYLAQLCFDTALQIRYNTGAVTRKL